MVQYANFKGKIMFPCLPAYYIEDNILKQASTYEPMQFLQFQLKIIHLTRIHIEQITLEETRKKQTQQRTKQHTLSLNQSRLQN